MHISTLVAAGGTERRRKTRRIMVKWCFALVMMSAVDDFIIMVTINGRKADFAVSFRLCIRSRIVSWTFFHTAQWSHTRLKPNRLFTSLVYFLMVFSYLNAWKKKHAPAGRRWLGKHVLTIILGIYPPPPPSLHAIAVFSEL